MTACVPPAAAPTAVSASAMPPVAKVATTAAMMPTAVSAVSSASAVSAFSLISRFAMALSTGLVHGSLASTCGNSMPRSSHS